MKFISCLLCFGNCPYNSRIFFQLFTESCRMNYCQDGLLVDFAIGSPNMYTLAQIYGHYELQPFAVNNRPYFKKDSYGFWYDGTALWIIGTVSNVGQPFGYALYNKDVFCPHELSELNWEYYNGFNWVPAGDGLSVTCRCIFIQTIAV